MFTLLNVHRSKALTDSKSDHKLEDQLRNLLNKFMKLTILTVKEPQLLTKYFKI